MAEKFKIKAGATLPTLDYVLKVSIDGADPVLISNDLTGASVKFVFKPKDGGAAIEVTGSVLSNTDKSVRCTFTSSTFTESTRTVYDFHVEVTLSGGGILKVPTENYDTIVVFADI